MTRTNGYRMALAAALLALGAQSAAANSVFVRATGSFGRGLTRTKAGECFVVTAEHVVRAPGPIQVMAFGGKTSAATVTYADKANDLAILAVTNPNAAICDDVDWPQPSSLNSVLGSANAGSLLLPNEAGTRDIKDVRMVGNVGQRVLTVKSVSNDPAQRLTLGHSGSVFVINNTPVGMLLGIDTNTGEGTVARFDFISGLISGFFDSGARFAIDPVKMKGAIARVIAAGKDDFDGLGRKYDSTIDSTGTTLYKVSVLLPGAEEATLFYRSRFPNYIRWAFPRVETLEEATILYESVSVAIKAAVPTRWRTEAFKGSDFIASSKTTEPGLGGQMIETVLRERPSGYEVEVKATAFDTDELIDVERETATAKRSEIGFNYKITNVSDVAVEVELTVEGYTRRKAESDAKERICARKEFKFKLGPHKDYRAKGTLGCEYDEDYNRYVRPVTAVTMLK